MSKRQEAAKQTRERIVRAAEKLHGERGLANASVDEIVAEAGVSKGSFYVYFKRKEDVAQAVAFRRFDELKREAELRSGTALERLSYFLRASARYIEEKGLGICKEWMKSAVCPMDGESQGMEKFRFDRDYIARTLGEARESGELSGDVPLEALADGILAEYYGCVALWSMTNGAFPMRARMEEFAGALERLPARCRTETTEEVICDE